jgi:plasmid stabilization system protein ParE
MRIRWTVPAANDLEGIKEYLEKRYPHFAEPTVRTIYQRVRSLKTAPNLGRPGHLGATRELPLTPLPYVVVYSVNAETVEILHIHHGAQDWRSD